MRCAIMFQREKKRGMLSQRVMRIKIEFFFFVLNQGRRQKKKIRTCMVRRMV